MLKPREGDGRLFCLTAKRKKEGKTPILAVNPSLFSAVCVGISPLHVRKNPANTSTLWLEWASSLTGVLVSLFSPSSAFAQDRFLSFMKEILE